MNGKIVLLGLMLATSSARADDSPDSSTATVQLLVLGASRSYEGLREDAKQAAADLGFAFSDRGLVYDEKNGLHWPEDFEDEMWAGGYVPRRYDDECEEHRGSAAGCISIESSDAYPGLKPGYFLIVAGLLGEDDAAKKRLEDVRNVVRDAYLTETTVYTGCLH